MVLLEQNIEKVVAYENPPKTSARRIFIINQAIVFAGPWVRSLYGAEIFEDFSDIFPYKFFILVLVTSCYNHILTYLFFICCRSPVLPGCDNDHRTFLRRKGSARVNRMSL